MTFYAIVPSIVGPVTFFGVIDARTRWASTSCVERVNGAGDRHSDVQQSLFESGIVGGFFAADHE